MPRRWALSAVGGSGRRCWRVDRTTGSASGSAGRRPSSPPGRATASDSTASGAERGGAGPGHDDLLAHDGTRGRPAPAAARPGAPGPDRRGPRRPAPSGILGAMNIGLRDRVLPENQRRTLDELSDDLDLRSGDTRAKQSAFWTMLVLSAIIATAGVLADSTATVIGAMIIAPLSTPIMGIALGIVKRERDPGRPVRRSRGGRRRAHRRRRRPRRARHRRARPTRRSPAAPHRPWSTSSRRSPPGLAGAVGLSRRDVAAVLPGVAIAISLVPPLAVVGICLGEGAVAAGARRPAALRLEPRLDGDRRHRALRGPGLLGRGRPGGRIGRSRAQVLRHARRPPRRRARAPRPEHRHSCSCCTRGRARSRRSPRTGSPASRRPRSPTSTFTSSSFRIEVRVPPGRPARRPTTCCARSTAQVPDGLSIVVDTTYGEEVDAGTTGSL